MKHASRVVLMMASAGRAAIAAHVQASAEAGVEALVHQLLAAEQAYDADGRAQVLAPECMAVSPAEWVDLHNCFLSFYPPDKNAARGDGSGLSSLAYAARRHKQNPQTEKADAEAPAHGLRLNGIRRAAV